MAEKVRVINEAASAEQETTAELRTRKYAIVGLGNPGVRYENTPHNIGFLVIERLAERHAISVRNNEGSTLTGKGTIGGNEVVLAKPLTFMNRSGTSVKSLLQTRRLGH